MFPKVKPIKDRKLLEEIRCYPCMVCDSAMGCDAHHIKTRGAGGGDTRENLLALCRTHHTEIHKIGKQTFFKKYPWLKRD